VERLGAPITHALPVSFITEGRWIARLLAELRPDAPCFHVPNGVAKDVFVSPPTPERTDPETPLRVLVEGSQNLWFKAIDSALAATERMTRARTVTLVTPEPPTAPVAAERVLGPLALEEMPAVYAETDVLLKLSRVEGVFTPPLEAFHLGATCVVSPVTGHDEYVVHGHNGFVAEWDDVPGTARWLDLLAQDRALLHRLRIGALETARAWPSWEQSTAAMAAALREIAAAPAPAVESAIAQLLAELQAGMEELRREQVAAKRAALYREAELSEGIAWRERRHQELTASRSHRFALRLQRLATTARRLRRPSL
jgi:glycosyltransferase involved in cell wall biosynthesis